jgi:acetylornithine deacetylase/succinyl-diaminopimelate desuccinylase family protein
MSNVTNLVADLVAIDSINPDLVSGGTGEGAIARFIADWLTAAGLEVRLDEIRPGRPNVIAIARGTGGGRTLMFNGHLDTVGVGGMTNPHQPVIKGDRLYGRGAYDMKGGLAACMVAIAEAQKRSLAGDVMFTAVMDEEFAGLGTIDIAAKYKADAAILAEPTEMQLVIAHKGFVWLEIETHGIAAHGSRSDLGVDAIAKMGKVLVELEMLNQRLLAESTHVLLKSGSLHASLINGGQELSSYPERCVLSVERRTIPGESPEFVEAQIREILQRLAAGDGQFKATVRRSLDRAPLETRDESGIAALVEHSASQVAGRTTEVAGVAYWTDAASLTQAGIPSVLFGPQGAGAHAVEEWVDLRSVQQCQAIYLRVIETFCR